MGGFVTSLREKLGIPEKPKEKPKTKEQAANEQKAMERAIPRRFEKPKPPAKRKPLVKDKDGVPLASLGGKK